MRWPRVPVVAWLWRDARRWFTAVALSVPLACLLDATLLGSDETAWVLAAAAWVAVLGAVPELPLNRRIALLCFLPLITVTELVLSHGLGWYAYRIGHVPPWIPPAHGIVFLTALRAIDTRAVATPTLAWSTAGAQALYGLVALAFWNDELGALFCLVFLTGMILLPPEGKRFYAALGITVAYLELVGTVAGTWTWAPVQFGLSEMNPPSGAVGGYSVVDGLAFLVAGLVALRLRARGQVTGARASASPALGTDPVSR